MWTDLNDSNVERNNGRLGASGTTLSEEWLRLDVIVRRRGSLSHCISSNSTPTLTL
jgi:hypothetical protein